MIGYLSAVTNYLPLSAEPQLRGLAEQYQAEVSPSQVSVLVIGPQPILDEIAANPSLVGVYLDVSGLEPGLYELPLLYESPSTVSVELFPSEVQVSIIEGQ